MRRDLNTCSRQSAMHHGVRVRVFFRWSSEHHSRNDSSSSSSTSWSHDVHVFSHIRTRYFSEGSVQQHLPPYSFRKRVLVRAVMKRLFFPWKAKGKKARFARAPHDNIVFTGPTIYLVLRSTSYQVYQPACLRALRHVRPTVFSFFF